MQTLEVGGGPLKFLTSRTLYLIKSTGEGYLGLPCFALVVALVVEQCECKTNF